MDIHVKEQWHIAGFFPGLGSRPCYHNLGRSLLDSGIPEVTKIYSESARVLGFPDHPDRLLMDSLPAGRLARQGYIGAALLTHSLVLDAHLRTLSARQDKPMRVVAYTGESFGIITAAVASGALSVGDGVRIAHAFTPLMLMAADGVSGGDHLARELTPYYPDSACQSPMVTEPYHVVGLRALRPEMIDEILGCLEKTFPRYDVELHKLYSGQQVNIYVRAGVKSVFDRFIGRFPDVAAQELKAPTTFLAHSARMWVARHALERFIDHNGIAFRNPHTPVVSNHDAGLLVTAAAVREGISAIADRIMMSRMTVATLKELQPELIVELGPGGKSLKLLTDNDTTIPLAAYTGTADHPDGLDIGWPPAQGRILGHDSRGAAADRYVNPGEDVVGFGEGGSESLTIFIRKAGDQEITVRKILSEALITARWSRRGEGVMLPPFTKAKRQFEYLRALPDGIRHYFPQAHRMLEREIDIHKEVIYEMSYVPGQELSEFIGAHCLPAEVIARLYQQILVALNRDIHTVDRTGAPGHTLEASYFRKIESRLDLCRRTAPLTFGRNLIDTETLVINGTTYLNSAALLRKFRRHREFHHVLEPRFHALVVGDTNTENIKITEFEPALNAQRLIESGASRAEIDAALNAITAESVGIRFLDPRSIGFDSEGAHTRDDPMYDAKVWHNSFGHYDEIHHEYFDIDLSTDHGRAPRVDIEFHQGNIYRRAYRGLENHFGEVMHSIYGSADPKYGNFSADPYWLVRFVFIMGTHFIAMPPFHFASDAQQVVTDDYRVQRRPVAIYCEGIQWLNWALDMLEGRRQEFLGVPVPALPYSLDVMSA